ncbi:MAG: hypothetical protein D6683_16585 [Actinomyces sp.]|nr:MAG: hypothetical protein D6683_16585 [Actinomyces sp.]
MSREHERVTVLNHTGFPAPDEVAATGVTVIEVSRDPDSPPPPEVTGEILWTRTDGGPHLLDLLGRGVRWVHTLGTGVDEFPLDALGDDQVLTCARGASGVPIAEWVVAHLLAAAKGLPEVWLHEAPGSWTTDVRVGGLTGATVVIVGAGGIGTEIVRRLLPFGCRLVVVRRRPVPLELDTPGVDSVRVTTDLGAVVGEADHLVLAAPATPATHHLVDADLLARARDGLHLVNVARGALVDQEALRAALDTGRVGLASLDTVEPEPLPAGHWLYTHPRVRLSPHVSWLGPGAVTAVVATFVDNLHRWLQGRPLVGVVDRTRRY